MSRTVRAVPVQFSGTEFGKTIERGQVSIPKLEFEGVDETWGQKPKKFRKRLISRKRRRELKAVQGNS